MNNAIGRVTSILSIPYGYTVTLWSAGALAFTRLGFPSVLDVFLFVLGAVAAFVVIAGVGYNHLDAEVPMRVPWLVVVNLFPIVAAVIVVAFPVSMVGRTLGYFADSFLATAAYILSLACLIRVARRFHGRATAPETELSR
jgi:hypothetical protein